MTREEQFLKIIQKEKEQEVIPFFKALSPEEKKNIAPYVKKLHKEYTEMHERRVSTSITFHSKGTDKQIHILNIAAFICYNRKDFEKLVWGITGIIEKGNLISILDWYCPDWFSAYINDFANKDWMPYNIKYLWLLELEEKGYLKGNPELIVKVLPAAIHDHKDGKPLFQPENLLRYRRTLEQDIWHLFQFESSINWSGRYMRFTTEQEKEGVDWIAVFKKNAAAGKIDRQKLLQESLLATTRNFNKILSGWFAELFLQLEPTKEELVQLQDALFTAFNSPHSKPVQTALQCCKKIVDTKEFRADDFLENAPLLLASETKSLLSNCLTLLDKLAKKHQERRPGIVQIASHALIHKQEDIQVKAAKLILSYGDPASETLKDTVEAYRESLLVNARTLLQEFFLEKEATIEQELTSPDTTLIRNKQELTPITTTDELIFLASQAFDNNAPEHFDLLPAALISLQGEIKGETITRLEPALQRAYKLVMGDMRSNIGFLDSLLATFFINYCNFLVEQHPDEAQSLQAIHNHYIQKDDEFQKQWSYYNLRIIPLEYWIAFKDDTLYNTHKSLLLTALNKLKNHDHLPLLSTPTHTLGLIDPVQLADRLKAYESRGIEPDAIDFQVAISRCDLDKAEDALPYASQQLLGEYTLLFRFLLQPDAMSEEPFVHESLWTVAALVKNPIAIDPAFKQIYQRIAPDQLTGQCTWKTIVEEYTYDQYKWENGKYKTIKVPDTRKVLRLSIKNKEEGGIKKLFTKFFTKKKEAEPLFHEWLTIRSKYVSAEANDIQRLLYLTPNNPEPLLAQVTRKCLESSTLSESHKKMVNVTLQALHGLWKTPGEMAHLFIATCMICSDKTAASFAAEIWLNGVQTDTINSTLIGSIIGRHERVEFAPLKRFTDLVMNQLLQISPLHNRELEKLLAAMIMELPENPIRNLKKLLEIYLEVISINHSTITQNMKDKIGGWNTSANLEKVIRALEKKCEPLQEKVIA